MGHQPKSSLTKAQKFKGEFQTLLSEHFIDHRLASREHPQADGLAEHMVQTMKQRLRKSLLERAATD